MLSEQEKQNHLEISKFWKDLYKPIMSKDFEKAKQGINIYIKFYKNHLKDENYYFWLLREIGWLRDDLESTQKNREKFEEGAKEVVTALNRLILILVFSIGKLPEEKQEYLFEIANNVFDPIFSHIEEKKNGYAYFGKSILDEDYYRNVYKNIVERFEEEEGIQLGKFKQWKKGYNEELKKKWQIKK